VVLHPQHHPPAERSGDAPDPDGVRDVAEVEEAGWTGSEAGEGSGRKSVAQGGEVEP
jgi:hypothetical protein